MPDRTLIEWVDERLADRFGPLPTRPSETVLSGLIGTILSQNTTGSNARLAYERLRAALPDWSDVAAAPPEVVVEAIRPAGLAATRGPRIQLICLEVIARHGAAELEHLRHEPDGQVIEALTAFPGVGPKTAACVLLFTLGRPVFPVDTHVNRIAARLGWVATGTRPAVTWRQLEPVIPVSLRGRLHVNLIRLGRSTCRAHRPACGDCPLAPRCPTAPKG